jgi:hypothetical protein
MPLPSESTGEWCYGALNIRLHNRWTRPNFTNSTSSVDCDYYYHGFL